MATIPAQYKEITEHLDDFASYISSLSNDYNPAKKRSRKVLECEDEGDYDPEDDYDPDMDELDDDEVATRLEDTSVEAICTYIGNLAFRYKTSNKGPIRTAAQKHHEQRGMLDQETNEVIHYVDIKTEEHDLNIENVETHKRAAILCVRRLLEMSKRMGCNLLGVAILHAKRSKRAKPFKANEAGELLHRWHAPTKKFAGYWELFCFKQGYRAVPSFSTALDYINTGNELLYPSSVIDLFNHINYICEAMHIALESEDINKFVGDNIPTSVITLMPSNDEYYDEVIKSYADMDLIDTVKPAEALKTVDYISRALPFLGRRDVSVFNEIGEYVSIPLHDTAEYDLRNIWQFIHKVTKTSPNYENMSYMNGVLHINEGLYIIIGSDIGGAYDFYFIHAAGYCIPVTKKYLPNSLPIFNIRKFVESVPYVEACWEVLE